MEDLSSALRRPANRMSGVFSASLPDLLVLGAVLVNVFIILAVTHFPYQDAPNHLARYTLIGRILDGETVPGIEFRWIPASYLALDLAGVGLVRLFGAPVAGKILACLAAVLPTLGLYLLIRVTAPERRGWALAGALLTFTWFLLAGLLTFVIGFGLALCYLAWWWARRERPGWAMPAGAAIAIALLFLVHLSAPLIAMGVMGVELFHEAMRGRRGVRGLLEQPTLRVLALCALMLAAVWAWTSSTGEYQFESGSQLVFRSIPSKVAAIGAPFYSFSMLQAGILAASYAVLLGIFVHRVGLRLLRDPFVSASMLFFVLFLVFPKDISGAGGTDIRWLMPAYLLPFCSAVPARSAPISPAILGVAFALSLTNAALFSVRASAIDRELSDYDRILDVLPQGSRVLPLVTTTKAYPRVSPFDQYAFWHVINVDGRVPGLWSLTGSRVNHKPLPHLQHFITAPWNYYPRPFEPLDWNRIAAEYDRVVYVGDPEESGVMIGPQMRLTAKAGLVRLYEPVHRSTAGAVQEQMGSRP